MNTYRMNPALKAEWTADLRTNGHLQGIGLLRSADEKYCAMGRLRVVAEWPWYDYDGTKHPEDPWMTPEKMSFIRLDDIDLARAGIYRDDEEYINGMNDNGMSFSEIADWIDKYL